VPFRNKFGAAALPFHVSVTRAARTAALAAAAAHGTEKQRERENAALCNNALRHTMEFV